MYEQEIHQTSIEAELAEVEDHGKDVQIKRSGH